MRWSSRQQRKKLMQKKTITNMFEKTGTNRK
jgi:hypothetical protein